MFWSDNLLLSLRPVVHPLGHPARSAIMRLVQCSLFPSWTQFSPARSAGYPHRTTMKLSQQIIFVEIRRFLYWGDEVSFQLYRCGKSVFTLQSVGAAAELTIPLTIPLSCQSRIYPVFEYPFRRLPIRDCRIYLVSMWCEEYLTKFGRYISNQMWDAEWFLRGINIREIH